MRLTIQVRSELGKLDLNSTSSALFIKVATALGVPAGQAKQVAAALQARQNGTDPTPMRTLEELIQLPGMDNAMFTRLEPYITVWSGYDQPVVSFAAPPIRQAMGQKNIISLEGEDPGQVLSVYSQAELDNGFRSALNVTLLLNPTDSNMQPYRVLRWQE
nr:MULTISPECIES: general secretion pathway protein GspK [Pseudomonas]